MRCLDSVLKSDYPNLETVVVDDASNEPVEPALRQRFPRVRFVRNGKRELLSRSRNRGAAIATGTYLFFLDDDNVLAPDAVSKLVETLSRSERIAVVSPLIYYLSRPTVVWTSYITRSWLPGFYTLHTDVPSSERRTFSFHNSFMTRQSVFDKLGGFDAETFPIRFSEVDLAHRIENAGYLALVNPSAMDWHDLGWAMVHIDSVRAYYTERNRIIVLKRYYRKSQLRFYEICILPLIAAYYLVHHPLSSNDGGIRTAASFLRGTMDGLRLQVRNGQSAHDR